MKLSKKITLVLSAIMLSCAVCPINNSAVATRSVSSVSSVSEDEDEPIENRWARESKIIEAGGNGKIGCFEDGEGGFLGLKPRGCLRGFKDIWFSDITSDPCKDLSELKAKLKLKQQKLLSKLPGLNLQDEPVFWVNIRLTNLDDDIYYNDDCYSCVSWNVNLYNKWYGEDVRESKDGVLMLFPWAAEYLISTGDRLTECRLREYILDASNWVAIKGMALMSTGVRCEAQHKISSLDEYTEYLKGMGLLSDDVFVPRRWINYQRRYEMLRCQGFESTQDSVSTRMYLGGWHYCADDSDGVPVDSSSDEDTSSDVDSDAEPLDPDKKNKTSSDVDSDAESIIRNRKNKTSSDVDSDTDSDAKPKDGSLDEDTSTISTIFSCILRCFGWEQD